MCWSLCRKDPVADLGALAERRGYSRHRYATFELQEMVRSFGTSRIATFWRIILRSAMPMVVAGLRLGMTRAIKGMIVGQLILSVFGLGHLSELYAGTFDSTGVLSIALVIVVIAMIAITLLELWGTSN